MSLSLVTGGGCGCEGCLWPPCGECMHCEDIVDLGGEGVVNRQCLKTICRNEVLSIDDIEIVIYNDDSQSISDVSGVATSAESTPKVTHKATSVVSTPGSANVTPSTKFTLGQVAKQEKMKKKRESLEKEKQAKKEVLEKIKKAKKEEKKGRKKEVEKRAKELKIVHQKLLKLAEREKLKAEKEPERDYAIDVSM